MLLQQHYHKNNNKNNGGRTFLENILKNAPITVDSIR